jgi:phosphopantetheinyl transferase
MVYAGEPGASGPSVFLTFIRFSEEDRCAWRETACAVLSEAERGMVDAMSDPDRQTEHAVGRATLRLHGARASGRRPEQVAMAISDAGKPSLVDTPDLELSVAHTGGVVVTAACWHNAVGVDVEPEPRSVSAARRLAQRRFSQPEVAALSDLPEAELPGWFSTVWTVKEAVGKALGVGIVPALSGATVQTRAGAPILTSVWSGPQADAWTIHTLVAPDGCEKIAVALPAPNVALGSITRYDLTAFRQALSEAAFPPAHVLCPGARSMG